MKCGSYRSRDHSADDSRVQVGPLCNIDKVSKKKTLVALRTVQILYNPPTSWATQPGLDWVISMIPFYLYYDLLFIFLKDLVVHYLKYTFLIDFFWRERKGRKRLRERNIDLFFHLGMQSLVDSYMCPVQRLNL